MWSQICTFSPSISISPSWFNSLKILFQPSCFYYNTRKQLASSANCISLKNTALTILVDSLHKLLEVTIYRWLHCSHRQGNIIFNSHSFSLLSVKLLTIFYSVEYTSFISAQFWITHIYIESLSALISIQLLMLGLTFSFIVPVIYLSTFISFGY